MSKIQLQRRELTPYQIDLVESFDKQNRSMLTNFADGKNIIFAASAIIGAAIKPTYGMKPKPR